MAKIQIETTQNVLLDFQLGDVGERIGAGLIDILFIVMYCFIAGITFSWIFSVSVFNSFSSSFVLYYLLFGLPILFYYPMFEFLWNGATPGKRVLKLKVLRVDGVKPTLGDFILRWVFRTLDVNGMFLFLIIFINSMDKNELTGLAVFSYIFPIPIIGMSFMIFTQNNQRLGDLVAKTVVVKTKKRASLEDTLLESLEKQYVPKIHNVLQLSDRDIRTIKEALDHYEKSNDDKHVTILAQKATQILNVKIKAKPDTLLRIILKDYNKLATEADVF